MTEDLRPHTNAVRLINPKTITTNREKSVQELRKWKILQDVPEMFLHQIRYTMVAHRTLKNSDCYALMVTKDDQAYVIGDNRWGQLGVDKSNKYIHTPTKVKQLSGLEITGFSASWYFASAWTKDGKLFMMGANNEGELGQGHQKELGLPHQVLPGLNVKVRKAASGDGHAICLTTDGSVYAWGRNNYRQCTPETVHPVVTTPTQIKFGTNKIVDISCTQSTSFAVTADGDLYAWGRNEDGEAGTGSAEKFVKTPTKIPFPSDESVKNISCGFRHCIVLTSNGMLFVWGRNADGDLGTGSQQEVPRTPIKLEIPNVSIISADNGSASSVCKTVDGKIYAWGGNCVKSYAPKCMEFKSINDCCAHYEMGMSESWTSQYSLDAIEPDCVSFLKLHSTVKPIPFEVEGTRITAPKIYLKRCAAFHEKLKQKWKQELQASNIITITGHKAKHFQIFINFLQTDRVEAALVEDLIDLYKLAHFYKMERFRFAVVDMIRKEMTAENVLQFYVAAVEHNDETLQWETINFFKPTSALEFLDTTNLTTVDPKYVVQYLVDVQALGAFKSQ